VPAVHAVQVDDPAAAAVPAAQATQTALEVCVQLGEAL
jgi:hypothetical protein